MADQTLELDCPERVAYDMTEKIRIQENKNLERAYILELYAQCLTVVRGYSPDKALAKKV